MRISKAKTTTQLRAVFDWVGELSEELIAVRKGVRWFHVHTDGIAAYRQRYCYVGLFCEGLARARNKHGKEFHIGLDGKPAYSQRYNEVENFINGQAMARVDEVWFKIYPDGTRVANVY